MKRSIPFKNLKEGVSVTTIVKTEDYVPNKIGRAFMSIAQYVEEFVLVWTGDPDTGFADDPDYIEGQQVAPPSWLEKACQGRPVKVVQSAWCWDFSHSRNVGIELCSHEWIFVIDADEIMPEPNPQAIHALAREDDAALLYFFPVLMLDGGNRNTEDMSRISGLRMFTNIPLHRYQGFVHNQLRFNRALAGHIDATIEHHGVAEQDVEKRRARNAKFQEKIMEHLAEHPEDLENVAKLCQTYSYDNNYEKVVEWGEKLWERIAPVSMSRPTDDEMEKIQEHGRLGYWVGLSKLFLGDVKGAYEFASPLSRWFESCDLYYVCGQAAYLMGDFPNAYLYFLRYMKRLPKEMSGQESTVCSTSISKEHVREKLFILAHAQRFGPDPFKQSGEPKPVRLRENNDGN